MIFDGHFQLKPLDDRTLPPCPHLCCPGAVSSPADPGRGRWPGRGLSPTAPADGNPGAGSARPHSEPGGGKAGRGAACAAGRQFLLGRGAEGQGAGRVAGGRGRWREAASWQPKSGPWSGSLCLYQSRKRARFSQLLGREFGHPHHDGWSEPPSYSIWSIGLGQAYISLPYLCRGECSPSPFHPPPCLHDVERMRMREVFPRHASVNPTALSAYDNPDPTAGASSSSWAKDLVGPK